MKRYVLTFLLLVYSSPSCMRPLVDPRSIKETDPAMIPYVAEFESHLNGEVTVPIGFADLTLPNIGQCRLWSNGYREIIIDPSDRKSVV